MPESDLPSRILLLGSPEAGLPEALQDLGCTVLVRDSCHALVHGAQDQGLDQGLEARLLCCAPEALDAWLGALAQFAPPLPGVCITPAASTAQRRLGLQLGLQVWLPVALPAPSMLEQLQWAQWQAQRLANLQTQLDERKWTEKAKGLLMAAQELDEASAFRLLRDAAMHAHLRLGEVARSVVEAAQLAEAVNLAGQQRMLSQRLVKLMAQRAAGIEAKRAKLLQDQSSERVSANLARLRTLLGAERAESLSALEQAWAALRAPLAGKPSAASLGEADAAAEALLDLSEQLTNSIEAGGARRPLRLVNLCGRQRMLSQRLAKNALLADLLPGRSPEQGAEMATGLGHFENGLLELERAPLSSAEIRASLATVREEWLRLLRSLRDVQGPEAAAGLARSSELLLVQLDQLTGQYQQSLQLILG